MEELLTRIAELVPTLPGWCPPEKAQWMAEAVVKEKFIHCVEIGVFAGRSLIPLALAVQHVNRGGYVLGIDPYQFERQVEAVDLDWHVSWARDIEYEKHFQDTLTLIRSFGVSSVCGLLRASSDEVACLIGPIDLLHVDGCHSVLASCRDVEVWAPKVRPGGLIVLDDADWSTVQEAREMLRETCGEPGYSAGAWEAYRAP